MAALENIRNKTALVFGGGGTLGIAAAGSIVRLEEFGLSLKKIKSLTGSSVGAILATGIACGANGEYIKRKLEEVSLKDLENRQCFMIEGARLINKFGLRKPSGVRKFVKSIFEDLHIDPNITFEELHEKTGVWLTITYLSLNYGRTIFADHIYEPKSSVLEAIMKSTAIPVFYESYVTKDKEICVDGGTQLNFPMIVPRLQKVDPKEILGIKFVSSGDVEVRDEGQPGIPEENTGAPKNVVEFLNKIVNILRKQAMKVHVSKNDWKLTVKINVGTLSSTDFDLTKDQKDWLYFQGRDSIDKYISELDELIKNEKF